MEFKKCENIITETYSTDLDDFMFDIVENEECYEAYIYRRSYGIKTHIFSCWKSQSTKEEFLEMVLVQFDQSAAIYNEENY